MAAASIELVENDQGTVHCTVNFDPPLIPGQALRPVHLRLMSLVRGTPLEKPVFQALALHASPGQVARLDL